MVCGMSEFYFQVFALISSSYEIGLVSALQH
jgi:hypothetical protein